MPKLKKEFYTREDTVTIAKELLGKKLVSFGVRGDAGMEITVYGSKRPLHSGHYGNWAPNPALLLSKLLASMKDDDGKEIDFSKTAIR